MTDERESYIFPVGTLKDFSTDVFMHFGVPKADAELAAEVLAKSDLRGIDSHGVARLHTYFEMLELGRINPNPRSRLSAVKPV
jgi:L-2-hydroxycarboxylate dehydrogenase (NAD+)